jgi:predicted porin
LNFLAAATSIALCAAQAVFAGEPTFGDPTVYGRLNLTLEHARVEVADADTKFVDNGSRLGVRAEKSIGDETSAMIQVEGQLRHDPNDWIDTNGSIVKSRDTWVGLQDAKLGTVRFGMMEGPLYHATYDEISMHNHDSGRSSDKLLAEGATGGRMSKSIYYRAPIAGPLKVEVLHAFLTKDPAKDNAANPRHDEFALTYEAGDAWVAGGYAESRNLQVDKAWTLAASTAVNGIVLAGLYERSAAIPLGGMTAYRSYGRIAAKYPVGKHEFHINYGVAGSLSTTPDSGAVQVTLAYNYNLTEQTKLYAFATRVGNKQNASYSFLDNTPDGAANSSIALGFRRNF